MRKQAMLLSALLIALALATPVCAQYADAISREFSVYVDAATADVTDAVSREFSVYVDAATTDITDSISREFSIYTGVAPVKMEKQLPDNRVVSMTDAAVSAVFPGYFYLESLDRSSGVRVEWPDSVSVGDKLDVIGTTGTTGDFERFVAASIVATTGTVQVGRLGMSNFALGGGDFLYDALTGVGQRGITGAAGLNNIGLMVRTTGRLTYLDANTFTIDDGSGVSVTCVTPATMPVDPAWQYAAVTAISSIKKTGETYGRLLRVISVDPIAVPPTPGEMIYIPAGDFLMGTPDDYTESHGSNEHPQHLVTLSGYYIGKYEVTRGEYRQFMDAGGYTNSAYWSTDGWSWKVSSNRTEPVYWAASQNWGSPPGAVTQTDNHPVVGVRYYEAEAFCNWAGGHLPTEAQWERAARWNSSTSHPNVYPWGDTWYAQSCNNWYDSLYPGWQTAPVGSYSSHPSPSGCQDMAGNVYEWCKDWYDGDYYSQSPSSDPQGPASGMGRVLRGGGWSDYSESYRCAARYGYAPQTIPGNPGPYNYDANRGFRLAR